jgi:hypothetical protein
MPQIRSSPTSDQNDSSSVFRRGAGSLRHRVHNTNMRFPTRPCSGPACRAVSFTTRTSRLPPRMVVGAGLDLPWCQPRQFASRTRRPGKQGRYNDGGDTDHAGTRQGRSSPAPTSMVMTPMTRLGGPGRASPAPTKVVATRLPNPAGVLYGQRLVFNLAHRAQPDNPQTSMRAFNATAGQAYAATIDVYTASGCVARPCCVCLGRLGGVWGRLSLQMLRDGGSGG